MLVRPAWRTSSTVNRFVGDATLFKWAMTGYVYDGSGVRVSNAEHNYNPGALAPKVVQIPYNLPKGDGTGVESDGTMMDVASPISRRFTGAGAPTQPKTHHNLPVAFLCWNARRRRCCGLPNGAVGGGQWSLGGNEAFQVVTQRLGQCKCTKYSCVFVLALESGLGSGWKAGKLFHLHCTVQ